MFILTKYEAQMGLFILIDSKNVALMVKHISTDIIIYNGIIYLNVSSLYFYAGYAPVALMVMHSP